MSINDRAPKPQPPVKRPEAKKEEKKPFVRKEHLTQRPFKDEDLLNQLRKQTGMSEKGSTK